ncbi:glycoside hydrolase [Lasiosphaeris hirsuta]|uniref:lytic cellulose monooxygenase (C4-dehydrogenating) n=1 Tax=Lasiosphaeris hirsuta TaxID=260670 RepID=A0AA39ZRP3_9PEZI|nr:glycoside hydrolase [Lasiosphaeris hirsuta]
MLLTHVITLLVGVRGCAAHGFVQYIDGEGIRYRGYDPGFRFQTPAPEVPGWYANNTDIGFVPPQSFQDADIICHKSAVPGHDYVNVQAGSNITLQWLTWPESHVGPIIDYLASCPERGCIDIDKKDLHFVKIAQQALKPGITSNTSWLKAWVIDDFIHRDFKWHVQVPDNLPAGTYVLRHEIIALHSAWDVNGAQAYPQCINLNVTTGGSRRITGGVPATSFYGAEDPGIHINVYNGMTDYPFPGPGLWS